MTLIPQPRTSPLALLAVVGLALGTVGCGSSPTSTPGPAGTAESKPAPVFSLAWSEYPSWSVFGVADSAKLIDRHAGAMGPIEKKWGVDIELKEADYDTCLTLYGAGNVDAVCITNMDVLSPSLTIPSNIILPTSTSDGADALIVSQKVKTLEDLKTVKAYGLSKSVSEYTFVRNLELLGQKEGDFKFTHMDPAAAATAMQVGQDGYDAIVVWNPFVMETLGKRKDTRVFFDSSKIPGEIIDSVAMARKSLSKPGGEAFAAAVVDTFYQVNQRMADPKTRDDTLVALGEKFSNLKLEAMKKVVQQTKFYKTPKEGLEVIQGKGLTPVMDKVVKFCVDHEMVDKAPKVEVRMAGKSSDAQVLFDPTYIQKVVAK